MAEMKKTAKRNKKNKKRKKSNAGRIVGIVLLIILVLIMILLGVFVWMTEKGKRELLGRLESEQQIAAPELENQEIVLEDEGEVVIYNGQRYRYNDNITSILCMGVDREDWTENKEDASGQADMLLLAILDMDKGTVKLWNISRDSMCDVDFYDGDNIYRDTKSAQVCLAYAYGDGKEGSCLNTVRSVSRLLYGMPIQSYAAIDMGAIQLLNDAVGGVEVVIHEEDILPSGFVPGTTMLLKGDDVNAYVRSRRTAAEDEPLDSNNNRMARQKQYMMNFIQKALAQTREDITTPVRLFQLLLEENNMITNINISRVSYLSSLFSHINFSEDSFWTVPGEVTEGEKYAEYHVDDQALYEKILETFYCREE